MASIDLLQPNLSTSSEGIAILKGSLSKQGRRFFQVKGRDAQGRSVTQTLNGNFKYNNRGRLTGGTITGLSLSFQGDTAWLVSGFSLSVSEYRKILSSRTRTRFFFSSILSGNDVIRGSSGVDGIFGYDGDDTIMGGAGNDTLDGGQGSDILDGDTTTGSGNDFLLGGGGNDTLFAYNADTIDGGEGDDLIRVSNDQAYQLQGGSGFDRIEFASSFWITGSFSLGANGIEVIDGNGGFILGTAAGDALNFGGITLTEIAFIDGSGGDDAITGSFAGDDLRGGEGNDLLIGNAGNDILQGGAGNDTLSADNGSDTLIGGIGADLLTGGDTSLSGPQIDVFTTRPGDSLLPTSSSVSIGIGAGTPDPALVTATFAFGNGVDIITDFHTAVSQDLINYSELPRDNPFDFPESSGLLRSPFFVDALEVDNAYVMSGTWNAALSIFTFVPTLGPDLDYLFFVASEPVDLKNGFSTTNASFIGSQAIVLLNPNLA